MCILCGKILSSGFTSKCYPKFFNWKKTFCYYYPLPFQGVYETPLPTSHTFSSPEAGLLLVSPKNRDLKERDLWGRECVTQGNLGFNAFTDAL